MTGRSVLRGEVRKERSWPAGAVEDQGERRPHGRLGQGLDVQGLDEN